LSATRLASFSMSTSRDAYRAPKDQPTSATRVSSSCTSSPVTQGRHHPKYPHLSVVHVVKERASGRLLPDRRKEARLYNIQRGGQRECSVPPDNPAPKTPRPPSQSPQHTPIVDSPDEVIRHVSSAGRSNRFCEGTAEPLQRPEQPTYTLPAASGATLQRCR